MSGGEGERIGPYEIAEKLGAGGMGVVYRALDPRIGREVAVKLLLDEVADDPERHRRFEREVRAIGALSHPNVLTIYDAGTHGGAPYLVTELLRGRSLRERLAAGPLERDEAVDIARQVARGLIAIHAGGIVHRDLKPSNLFLCDDGTAKILDFGVARRLTGDDTVTRDGAVVGTPKYMAPEQVRGREPTPQTDVFSLGVVLYEMVAGVRPFPGETDLEVAAAILEDEPARLPDADLDAITRRCLAKAPGDRYAGAAEVLHALDGRPARRGYAAVAAGVGLIALGGLGVMWLAAGRDGRSSLPADAGARAERPVASPPISERRLTSMPPDRWVITMAAASDGELFAYSNHDSLFVQRLDGMPRRIQLAEGQSHANVYGFTPDARRVLLNVADDQHAHVEMLDLVDGTSSPVAERAQPWRLSPDGRYTLLLTPDPVPDSLHLVDVATGDRRVVAALGPDPRPGSDHAWSPDSRYIAMIAPWPEPDSASVELVVVPIDADGEAHVVPVGADVGQRGQARGITWRDEGHVLYVAANPAGGNALWEVGIRDGRWDGAPPVERYRWAEGDIDWMAYRGGRLYFVKSRVQEDVLVLPLDDDGLAAGPPVRLTNHDANDELRGGWTADGRVVFASNRFGTYDIFVQAPDAEDATLLVGGPEWDRHPVATSDAVLFWRGEPRAGQRCHLMRAELDGGAVTELLSRRCTTAMVACSPRDPARCVLAELEGEPTSELPIPAPETTVFSRLDPRSGEATEIARASTGRVLPFKPYDFDPDGRAILPNGDGIALLDLATGDVTEVASKVAPSGVRHAASTGGRGGWLAQPRMWNSGGLDWVRPDGGSTQLWDIGSDRLLTFHVSPDGRSVAGAVRNVDANVWVLENLP